MSPIPLVYRLFFLYIEPLSALLGFLCAWFRPTTYLALTDPSSSPLSTTTTKFIDSLLAASTTPAILTASHIALRQLGNLYLTFSLNEALVLRSTDDLKVWRALLFVLLVADAGHLLACLPRGWEIYIGVAKWNAMDWGNLGFVYGCATLRICFFAGLGFENSPVKKVSPAKANGKSSSGAKSNTITDKVDSAFTMGSPLQASKPGNTVLPTDHDTVVVDPSAEQPAVTPKAKRGRKKKTQ